jgi:hypothetical protein
MRDLTVRSIYHCMRLCCLRIQTLSLPLLLLLPLLLKLLYANLLRAITAGLNCRGTYCFGARLSDFPTIVLKLYPDNVFPLRNEDYVICTGWGGVQCVIRLQPSFGGSYWILVRSWNVIETFFHAHMVMTLQFVHASCTCLLQDRLY